MKKLLILLCTIHFSYILNAQNTGLIWHKVTALPEIDLYSVDNINGKIYAGASDKIYFSDNGVSWDSATLNPATGGVEDICYYDDRLFAATFLQGVFVSGDNGYTWSRHNVGLSSNSAVEFAIRHNTLYVATDDNGVFRYNPSTSSWSNFSRGLVGTSVFYTIANTDSCLVGGVGANGVITLYYDTANAWEYSYLMGTLAPDFTTFDVLQAGSYIWAFTSAKAFASVDHGKTWTRVNAGMRVGDNCRGLQVGDTLFATVCFGGGATILYKRSLNAPLQDAWISVDTFYNYTTDIAYRDGRLYAATLNGLIYTDIYDRAGIVEKSPVVQCSLYPNPVNTYVNISFAETAYYHIALTNVLGRVLYAVNDVSDNIKGIDMSAYAPGAYILSITDDNGNCYTQRIIKR